MKHDNTVAIGGSFFGGKTMSDEEKTAVQIDFEQKLTESGETAEEKEKRISKEKQKRKCIIVVLIVSALIFSGFADGIVSRPTKQTRSLTWRNRNIFGSMQTYIRKNLRSKRRVGIPFITI